MGIPESISWRFAKLASPFPVERAASAAITTSLGENGEIKLDAIARNVDHSLVIRAW